MKKKVTFVITKSNWGGAQRYVFNLANALPKDTHEILVAFGGTGLPNAQAGELQKRLEAVNIRSVFIRSFARDIFFSKDLMAVYELYKIYRAEKPDTVHLNSSKAGGVGALSARLAGVPNIIFTSHGLAWDEDRNALSRCAIKIFSWFTFLLCHKVVVISKNTFERARGLPFCSKKMYFVPNGLPLLQFEDQEAARVFLAQKTNITDDTSIWIGTVAELTQNKALSSLIEAVHILIQQGKKLHLFIIGGGEEEQRLRTQIKEADLQKYVHLVGFIADGYRYDKAFNIFMLTSTKEGLPTAILEAGQASCPVIATRIPGNTDIIENGKTGLLVEPKNAHDIAEKIATLIDNPNMRTQLGTALQQKVLTNFSLERMVEETQKLYLS